MKILIPIIGLALALSPAAALAKAQKAGSHAAHMGKTSCKGEFMYSKGGKCMDARNKAA